MQWVFGAVETLATLLAAIIIAMAAVNAGAHHLWAEAILHTLIALIVGGRVVSIVAQQKAKTALDAVDRKRQKNR